LEVHETKDSFVYKRIMEVSIFFDLFMISLNFQFWTYFYYDEALQVEESKLRMLFLGCIGPFLLAKLMCRFWPWAKPKL